MPNLETPMHPEGQLSSDKACASLKLKFEYRVKFWPNILLFI